MTAQLDIPTPNKDRLENISSASFALLLRVSTQLSSTHHLEELLAMVMEAATQLTNTQKASILLVNRKTGLLHFAASTHGEVPKDLVVPLDNSIAGWVVQNGQSVVVGDVQSDERFYGNIDKNLDYVTRSMIAVPMTTQTGVIGALEVLNKLDDSPYTEQDIALLEALASQSAVAITNAYLFDQSDLLAEVMHEIKTPLMALTSASELLIRPDLPEAQQTAVIQMIRRETARLSKMTKDFLDFARLESGREKLLHEPINLFEVLHDVVHIATQQAAERGIMIVEELDTDLPAPEQLVGDSDKIKQVILNLVSNAIKYNRVNGRITITAHRYEQEVHLGIADTGQGISPEDLEHLFERFYRIPGSDAEGTGLGLSIAQKIVEEHNGRIEVDSVIDEGTTFTICLPILSA